MIANRLMCGRIAIAHPRFPRLERAMGQQYPPLHLCYNVAPTMPIPVVRLGAKGYELVPMRWGLVPSWSETANPKFSAFNARVETAAVKRAFRESFRRRRCVIPVSGFFEWRVESGRKQPYFITAADGEGLALAGLWDEWRGEGKILLSCTILVGPPNELVAPLHDRMPVILKEENIRPWLDPQTPIARLQNLLSPLPSADLQAFPVSAKVNSVRNDSPDLIAPV